MNLSKIASIVVSAAATTGMILVGLRAVASLDSGYLQSTRRTLSSAATNMQQALRQPAEGLLAAAQRVPVGIDNDLRSLNNAYGTIRSGAEPNTFQKSRIQSLEGRLKTIVEANTKDFKDAGIEYAVLSDKGIVIFSASTSLPKGKSLNAVLAPQKEAVDSEEAASPPDLFTRLTTRGSQRGILSDSGGLRYFAVTPIFLRSRFSGAVVVQRRLSTLPALSEGVRAIVMAADGQVLLGDKDVEVPTTELHAPFVAVPRDPEALIAGAVSMGFSGLFMKNQAGVWAQRFELPALQAGYGFVLYDNSPDFARLRGIQLLLIILGGFVMLVQLVAMAFGTGRGLAPSISAISDFLGQLQQGRAEKHRLIEAELPHELHRLARAINKLIEQAGSKAGDVTALTTAPSMDEVLDAQGMMPDAFSDEVMPPTDAPPDFSGLDGVPAASPGESNAIEDSFPEFSQDAAPQSDLDNAPTQVMMIGESTDGYGDALSEVVAEMPATTSPAPGVDISDGGFAAIDNLTDEHRGPPVAPPAPPLDAFADDKDLEGVEFSSSSADPAATAIMRVSPDLLEQMRTTDESDATAADPFGATETDFAQPPVFNAAFAEGADPAATAVMKITPDFLDQLRERGDAALNDLPPPPPIRPAQAPEPAPAPEHLPATEVSDASILSLDPEPVVNPQTAHFTQVYGEFISTRRQCGESDKLAFDKFSARLEKSRLAVMQKTGCADVRFQVYVKNGKAALKATPA